MTDPADIWKPGIELEWHADEFPESIRIRHGVHTVLYTVKTWVVDDRPPRPTWPAP